MHLHLEHCRLNACPRLQVAELRCAHVADADPLHEPRINKLFHRPPGLSQRHLRQLHRGRICIWIEKPPRRIAGFKRHVSKGDREVHQIAVKRIEPQVAERAFQGWPHMLGCVVGVPEFGGHPQVITAAVPGSQCLLKTCACFCLVAIVARTVEMAVADTDRLFDQTSDVCRCNLPEAEAHRGQGLLGVAKRGSNSNRQAGIRHRRRCSHNGRQKRQRYAPQPTPADPVPGISDGKGSPRSADVPRGASNPTNNPPYGLRKKLIERMWLLRSAPSSATSICWYRYPISVRRRFRELDCLPSPTKSLFWL